MPLIFQENRNMVSRELPSKRSVFDSRYDNTHVNEEDTTGGPTKKRWKFKGPWLAGKTDGEFKIYVEKKVKRRKSDFRQYLRDHLTQTTAAARRREAVERGENVETLSSEEVAVSEEEVGGYIRHLRNNEMDLHRLVENFLDLPREENQSLRGSSSHYDEKGPPTTHPSAGLSYLRTNSHIYNHPLLGPQENSAPIQGRVIVPQKTGDKVNPEALIGLAGVVGKDTRKSFFKVKGDDGGAGIGRFDPDILGGGKIWAHPQRASIDSRGRIDLAVDPSDRNALNVALGVHSDEPEPPRAAVAAAQDRELPDLTQRQQRSSGQSSGYGLEGMTSGNRGGRVSPFLGPDDKMSSSTLQQLLKTGSL
jgi:hypothetical protein